VRTRHWLLCAGLTIGGTAWGADEEITPFQDGAQAKPSLEEEDRVWAEGEKGEKSLLKSGHVHSKAALSAYLQTVLDRLFPDFQGKVRIKVIYDSGLNAFAFPQGAIFFNMGLLARLDNEAQLAAILAHEGTHFTHRHSFRNHQSAKGLSGFAMTAGLLGGGGVALLGNLAAVSSMAGFSRDLEREADRLGYERLAKAGYDVRESVKCFQLLAEEARVLDSKDPFFFASHPRLQERIESFESLISEHRGEAGEIGAERFVQATQGLREEWLQAQIGAGKPKSVIHVLTTPALRTQYPDRKSVV
jgi:predicted Zn-dependent protease